MIGLWIPENGMKLNNLSINTMNLTPKIVEMMAKEYEENQKYKVKPWELKKGDKARH